MNPASLPLAQIGGPTTTGVTVTIAAVLGIAVLAGLAAGSVALAFRWYVRERVPTGLALLGGLAVVAVSLSTTTLLANEIAPDGPDIELVTALVHVVAFLTSGLSAYAGTRFGDRLGVDLYAAGASGDVDADVSEIVQTVGRVTSVQLPEEIADIVGYDPVPEETKETLAGRRFLFPRRLTKTELRDRLVSRLKTDYGVGHVDLEFAEDGSISFLAVGSRAAGIGPTLPPATNAVAIRADPAHAASAGDLVQVWETEPMRRVVTGELRGVAGDVVTVAIDAADTPKLDPTERYKLVTLPVQDRPDREFASLLRAADETLATVTVEAGSDLDGVGLGALGVTVAAITREDEAPEPLPARSRTLQAGDVLYAIATPELLRKLEDAATGPVGGGSSVVSPSTARPTESPSETAESRAAQSEAEPQTQRADSASQSANADEGPANADDEPTEAPEPSDDGVAQSNDAGASDQTQTDAPNRDGNAGDSVPGGDAFPDTADLPGMDGDVEVPDLADETSEDPSADGASGDGDADADLGDLGTDDPTGEDPLAADNFDALDTDDSVDSFEMDDPLDDADEAVGDVPVDDLLDDHPDGDADGDETGARADDAGSDDGGDDESVPFTPLDVGDEDPLSDPLTEGSDDDGDDGRDESGRPN